jgi:hypothetical protein
MYTLQFCTSLARFLFTLSLGMIYFVCEYYYRIFLTYCTAQVPPGSNIWTHAASSRPNARSLNKKRASYYIPKSVNHVVHNTPSTLSVNSGKEKTVRFAADLVLLPTAGTQVARGAIKGKLYKWEYPARGNGGKKNKQKNKCGYSAPKKSESRKCGRRLANSGDWRRPQSQHPWSDTRHGSIRRNDCDTGDENDCVGPQEMPVHEERESSYERGRNRAEATSCRAFASRSNFQLPLLRLGEKKQDVRRRKPENGGGEGRFLWVEWGSSKALKAVAVPWFCSSIKILTYESVPDCERELQRLMRSDRDRVIQASHST